MRMSNIMLEHVDARIWWKCSHDNNDARDNNPPPKKKTRWMVVFEYQLHLHVCAGFDMLAQLQSNV